MIGNHNQQHSRPSAAPRGRRRLAVLALVAATLAAPTLGQTRARPAPSKRTAPATRPAPETRAPAAPSPLTFWNTDVAPLLENRCSKCHAGVRQRGGLDLRSLETILRGGDSGPAIAPGRPDVSRLFQYVQPKAPLHMPPDAGKQLTPAEIGTLKRWIAILPAPKVKPVAGANANVAWAHDYVAELDHRFQRHETPPAGLAPSATIDWFLATDWRRDGVAPARPCDDATFLRRVTLDIAGRIPTRDEARQFFADAPPSRRRESLVARLLDSPDYARHMRETFDPILMGRTAGTGPPRRGRGGRRGPAPTGQDSAWLAYLDDAFQHNRPWNAMVRDMLVARATEGPARGAPWFLAERNNSHQAIAEAVAPIVFGVKINCAQCHNHPLVWEIEQRHYWGLVAAFERSKNIDTETGPGVAESAVGGFIKFANLKKETQPAELVFLNGTSVPEKAPGPDEKEADTPDRYLVPPAPDGKRPLSPAVPKFSRREALADLTTRNNPMLARAFVNRMWDALMGRGLVMPVDEIDSRHPASHPELLAWLTRDFEQSGYDVKRLVRTIVQTNAYQLDTRPGGKSAPPPDSFARALDKPLTAEQLVHSLLIATGAPPDGEERLDRAFAAKFPDVMPATYSPTLQQALFLSNSPLLEELLKPAAGTMLARLIALPSADARVREAFGAVLGRAPDAAELKQCRAVLEGQKAVTGAKNLLWALLTCAEFQVNH